MQDQEQRGGSLKDKVVKRAKSEVSSNQVVSATKERASAAAQAAIAQLPATREDLARLQESLDRIETALVHLQARVDGMAKPPRPKRAAAASAGDAKPEG